jgi:hypothetical protein
MKRVAVSIVTIAFLVLTCSTIAQAHTVKCAWGASPDAKNNPSLTYTVSRAPGMCSPTSVFVVLKSGIPSTTLTYSDAAVPLGSYCYTVSATVNGVSSGTAANPNPVASATISPATPGAIVLTIN